jgi:hypothetical protein
MCDLKRGNKEATGKRVQEESTEKHPGTVGKFSQVDLLPSVLY